MVRGSLGMCRCKGQVLDNWTCRGDRIRSLLRTLGGRFRDIGKVTSEEPILAGKSISSCAPAEPGWHVPI